MTWFLNLFRRKPLIKLMSLLGAIILWSFVMNEQNPITETTLQVPVEYLHTAEHTQVTASQSDVRVKLRGPRAAVASLKKRDVHAFLDIERMADGYHRVHVQTAVPQGLEVIGTAPDALHVLIDPLKEQQVTPNLIQAGSVASGFTVAEVTSEEEQVTIFGPASKVASVAQVIGYVGLTNDRIADFDLDVPLSAVDEDGRAMQDVTIAPPSMKVHVALARGLSRRVVDVKPVFEGIIHKDYALTNTRIEPARIEIAGDTAVLDKITFLETESIDIGKLTTPTKTTVSLILPDGVTVANPSAVVMLTIQRKK